jgi:acyl-CoA hydrolase
MQQSEVTFRFLAEPGDVNFGGKAHGGTVMKWIDQAAYACAVGWSGRYCVTVYVGGIRFFHPVLIGDLVEVKARVIDTGTSSMHMAVDVWARDPKGAEARKTTHCVVVFVAVNDDGEPVPVPDYEPTNEVERAYQKYARRLVELRGAIEEEMRPFQREV